MTKDENINWLLANTPCKTKKEVVEEALNLAKYLRQYDMDGKDIMVRDLISIKGGSSNIYGALRIIYFETLGIGINHRWMQITK